MGPLTTSILVYTRHPSSHHAIGPRLQRIGYLSISFSLPLQIWRRRWRNGEEYVASIEMPFAMHRRRMAKWLTDRLGLTACVVAASAGVGAAASRANAGSRWGSPVEAVAGARAGSVPRATAAVRRCQSAATARTWGDLAAPRDAALSQRRQHPPARVRNPRGPPVDGRWRAGHSSGGRCPRGRCHASPAVAARPDLSDGDSFRTLDSVPGPAVGVEAPCQVGRAWYRNGLGGWGGVRGAQGEQRIRILFLFLTARRRGVIRTTVPRGICKMPSVPSHQRTGCGRG